MKNNIVEVKGLQKKYNNFMMLIASFQNIFYVIIIYFMSNKMEKCIRGNKNVINVTFFCT